MKNIIKNNECASICAKCGGECCMRMPGAYTPDQLGLIPGKDEDNAKIIASLFPNEKQPIKHQLALDIGKPSSYTFFGEYEPLSAEELAMHDWCRGYVVIPAPGEYSCKYWDCLRGCKLPFAERPTMCKALVPAAPDSDGHRFCSSEISLRELSRIWAPYQDLLKTVDRLSSLRRHHENVYSQCYGKNDISSEMIMFFLNNKKDVWDYCFAVFEEAEKRRKAEEAERLKQESNPLYLALKGAGF